MHSAEMLKTVPLLIYLFMFMKDAQNNISCVKDPLTQETDPGAPKGIIFLLKRAINWPLILHFLSTWIISLILVNVRDCSFEM